MDLEWTQRLLPVTAAEGEGRKTHVRFVKFRRGRRHVVELELVPTDFGEEWCIVRYTETDA
jgi:hypothetical protein